MRHSFFLPFLWALAFKELRFSRRKLRLVMLVLTIGFIGPFFSAALRSSVADYLQISSRRMLSADLAVSSLKPFAPNEVEWLKHEFGDQHVIQETEFVTMARATASAVAVLVEVKGVDPNFPISGEFKFATGPPVRTAHALSGDELLAWAYPEVLAQLGLKVGDKIGVGKAEFRVAAELAEAPGLARTGGFAPRLYIGRNHIEATGLTQYGAQVFHRAYLELPVGMSPDVAGAAVKEALQDPDIFIRTPDDAVQGFERFFRFFNLYLVTISMIVFVLSWMSAFYILQIYLEEKLKNAAVLMVNGASRLKVGTLYAIQVAVVLGLAFVVAGIFVLSALALATPLFRAQLPDGFQLALSGSDLWRLALVALVSALAFNAPFFVRLYFLRLQALLSESAISVVRVPGALIGLSYLPLIAIFLGMSALLVGSWHEALRVSGLMLLTAVVGLIAGQLLFRGFFALVKNRPGLTRLVAVSLARSRFGMSLCFLALVLVTLALNLVPHLLRSVVTEIQPLQGKEVPALFLFNIPESQLDTMKAFAVNHHVELRFLSPLILGRLKQINGQATENDQFQRFPVRLSFRDHPIPSERIVAGQMATTVFDSAISQDAQISVETGFAERNHLQLGDEMSFDVQGLPIQARITSLRHVQWTSFNPNFFIMFQPGVLDDAPKTWIANVNLEDGSEREKVKLQYELARAFPDVTVIDIGRAIGRVLEIAQSVIGPVRAAAWLAVILSFLIMIGVVSHNLRLRDVEIDIEKLLGADASLIRNLLLAEYGVLAVLAWSVGAVSAAAIAWVVMNQVLDVHLALSFAAIAGSFAVVVVFTVAIAFVSISRVLHLRGASRKL